MSGNWRALFGFSMMYRTRDEHVLKYSIRILCMDIFFIIYSSSPPPVNREFS